MTLRHSGIDGMDKWTEVYERYSSLVWATVFRILGNHAEALDCCQDVFAEVLRGSSAQRVRNWPAFLKWLATRRAIDRLRRRRADTARLQADAKVTSVPGMAPSPDARAISAELIERLKCELSRLPEQQAEAFWLLSVEQMNYQEIGEQMGVPVNEVGVLVHRARQRLREWLVDLKPSGRESPVTPKNS
jgi:RNA polymerase sigma-70 factor (ECF subfamily)